MSDSEDPVDLPDDAGDDLFGDGDLDDIPSDNENGNVVSEKDLASDQEGGEQQGYDGGDMDMDQQEVKEKLVLNTQMYRHRTPKSKDGVVRFTAPFPHVLRFALLTLPTAPLPPSARLSQVCRRGIPPRHLPANRVGHGKHQQR